MLRNRFIRSSEKTFPQTSTRFYLEQPVAPKWPLERMQVQGTSALVSIVLAHCLYLMESSFKVNSSKYEDNVANKLKYRVYLAPKCTFKHAACYRSALFCYMQFLNHEDSLAGKTRHEVMTRAMLLVSPLHAASFS